MLSTGTACRHDRPGRSGHCPWLTNAKRAAQTRIIHAGSVLS
jgi:hypothetical protein